jgi:hypothetical protein
METSLIKVSERQKADMLVELLNSMDFIESVDYVDDLKSFKEAFNKITKTSASNGFEELTMEEINDEIKQYRLKNN